MSSGWLSTYGPVSDCIGSLALQKLTNFVQQVDDIVSINIFSEY